MLHGEEYRHFRMAALFSACLGLLVTIFLVIYGKTDSFLVINKFNSPGFDYFFHYYTYLGDGIIWIPLVAYGLLIRREYLVAIVAAVIISTLLSQIGKHVLFPDALRPIGTLKDKLHMVNGVEIYSRNSFPSGHTTQAFTMALLMANIVRKDIWVFFFPLIAFFVGYSRVYLAEHFVTDVLGGICIGIISAFLSLLIYEAYRKKQLQNIQKEQPV